jgi:hypothetical protein
MRLCALPKRRVETPAAAAEKDEKQGDETIGHEEAAVIAHRRPATWKMHRPISDRRVTRHKEGGVAREQPHREQQASDQLNDTRDADHGQQLDTGGARVWKSEPFRETMLKDQQAEHDSQE